jgi:phosphohistidine phosphatase SixA
MSHFPARSAVLLTLLLALAATGCATPADRTARTEADGVVFVLVRHAEKAKDDPKDPTLSEAGIARAERIAGSLADAPVRATYATAYRRTQLTATPTARSHRLDVRTYDAALPAADFARQLRASHSTGTVLVVGHSNTIPDLAAALCACPVAKLAEDEFDRWMEISLGADGRAALAQRRY